MLVRAKCEKINIKSLNARYHIVGLVGSGQKSHDSLLSLFFLDPFNLVVKIES